jgi:hypothetical protein
MTELSAYDLSAAPWRKSSASGAEHDCVEIADLPYGAKAIRDSKRPTTAPLRCTATEWAGFRRRCHLGRTLNSITLPPNGDLIRHARRNRSPPRPS